MQVSELIQLLSALDKRSEVVFTTSGGGCNECNPYGYENSYDVNYAIPVTTTQRTKPKTKIHLREF